MILIPKHQDLHIPLPQIQVGLSGHIKIEAYRGRELPGTGTPDQWHVEMIDGTRVWSFGSEREALDFMASMRYPLRVEYEMGAPNKILEEPGSRHELADFHNIITNTGLDHIGSNSLWLSHCHIGTGTATETASDTALGTFVRAHDSVESSTSTAQSSAPYYGKTVKVYRFDPPGSNHNYAEIGFSTQDTTGELFSRARIKDGGGTPTTISVLADEWLDVTYEIRQYPDHVSADDTGTVDGYDYTLRAADVTTAGAGGWNALITGVGVKAGFNPGNSSRWVAYSSDATLGAVTGVPTASGNDTILSSEESGSVSAYSDTTYNVDITYQAGLSDANVSGGIKAMMIWNTFGKYQVSFDPVIDKDNTKTLDITFNVAWTRATIP